MFFVKNLKKIALFFSVSAVFFNAPILSFDPQIGIFFDSSFCALAQQSPTIISDINFSEGNKLSIKLNSDADYKIFTLSNPNRVSVEIKNGEIDKKLSPKKPDYVSKITFDKNGDKLLINIFFNDKYVNKNNSFDKANKIISTQLNLKNSSNKKTGEEAQESRAKAIIETASPAQIKSAENSKKIEKNAVKNNKNDEINDKLDSVIAKIQDDLDVENQTENEAQNKSPAPTESKSASPAPKQPKKEELKKDENLIIKKTPNSIVKYKVRTPNSKKGAQIVADQQNNINAPTSEIKLPAKKPVIVIDAGHGGKDPGTIGLFARTKEKNITLSYAKELAKHLVNEKKYKVFLTRDEDFFIPLDKRVAKSRKKKADLFISLHANSIADKNVSGFSIYTLSENSSDKQAELLAQKENQADIINGIDFSGASKDIMKTLIDLSQRESKNSSARLAKYIIHEVKKAEIEILQNTHRFAGFMVLTAPDMASVLIELGYLSNKTEEKMLNSVGYRRLVAQTLASAINEYFKNYK